MDDITNFYVLKFHHFPTWLIKSILPKIQWTNQNSTYFISSKRILLKTIKLVSNYITFQLIQDMLSDFWASNSSQCLLQKILSISFSYYPRSLVLTNHFIYFWCTFYHKDRRKDIFFSSYKLNIWSSKLNVQFMQLKPLKSL